MEFKGSQTQPSGGSRNPEPTRPTISTHPQSVTQTQGGGIEPTHTMQMQTSPKSNNSKTLMAVLAVVVVLVLIFGALMMVKTKGGSSESAIKDGQYQAVFLTNGQVYFGKLSNVDRQYVELSDIYYLQVQQSVQPDEKATDDQPQVSLAKLGSELHAPEDVMHISRDQVLFWENLKSDGKVTEAIKSDQAK